MKRLVYPILSVSCELLCINWNEPQAAAYIIQAAFEQGLITSWWMRTEFVVPGYPQGQSRTSYQEFVHTLETIRTIPRFQSRTTKGSLV